METPNTSPRLTLEVVVAVEEVTPTASTVRSEKVVEVSAVLVFATLMDSLLTAMLMMTEPVVMLLKLMF